MRKILLRSDVLKPDSAPQSKGLRKHIQEAVDKFVVVPGQKKKKDGSFKPMEKGELDDSFVDRAAKYLVYTFGRAAPAGSFSSQPEAMQPPALRPRQLLPRTRSAPKRRVPVLPARRAAASANATRSARAPKASPAAVMLPA